MSTKRGVRPHLRKPKAVKEEWKECLRKAKGENYAETELDFHKDQSHGLALIHNVILFTLW